MNRYEKYKDSGVQWIGEVPSHWDITPLKYLCSISDKKNDDGVERRMLSVSQYHGIIEKIYDSDVQVRDSEESSSYWVVEDNDLVINTMWLNYRGLGVSFGKYGFVSPGYRVYHLNLNLLNPKFIHYLMRSDDYVLTYTRLLRGIRPNSLQVSTYDFQHIDLYVPPLTEQHQIVSFLDEKTSLIDDLIKKKEQKIGLLKEYRTSLINRVITKGLNPDCPMKDSGVEWIGEIPSHWDVRKLKYGVSHIVEKGQPSSSDVKISPENIESGTGRCLSLYSDYEGEGFEFHQGDVLLNKLRLYLKKIYLTTSDGYSMGEMIVLRPIDGLMNNKYLFNTLFHQGLIDLLDSQSNGVKLPRVSPDVIINTDVMYPPLPEQEQIVSFLDEKTGEIDRTIQSEKNKIELLKEYRQSLISSVITGKIKVVN